METSSWDHWVEQALSKLVSLKLIRSLRPIQLENADEYQVFDELREWDRASIQVEIADSTFQRWLQEIPSSGLSVLFSYVQATDMLSKKGGTPLDFEFVEHHKTTTFTFTSIGKESIICNIDGELFKAHKLSAQVFRRLINVFATGPQL